LGVESVIEVLGTRVHRVPWSACLAAFIDDPLSLRRHFEKVAEVCKLQARSISAHAQS
jgi:hypothetical protein